MKENFLSPKTSIIYFVVSAALLISGGAMMRLSAQIVGATLSGHGH